MDFEHPAPGTWPLAGFTQPDPDDPGFESEMAAFNEKVSYYAVLQGLPRVGARLVNAHGIEWVVAGHTFARGMSALGKPWTAPTPADLVTVSFPQNLSAPLTRMIEELALCTPREIVFLDTTPNLRKQANHGEHWVDSLADSHRILCFFDAAHAHEDAIAHQLAYVWLETVEEIEDLRVLRDTSDPALYAEVQRLQSLVLEFIAGRILTSRGLQPAKADHEHAEAIESLARAVANGYTPANRLERLDLSVTLARRFLQSHDGANDDALKRIRNGFPGEWGLAERFAYAIRSEHLESSESARRAIDSILAAAFDFADLPLDLQADLIELEPRVEWRDKWPGWLDGLTPRQKAEVGKAIARHGAGRDMHIQLERADFGCQARFSIDRQNWSRPYPMPFEFPDKPPFPPGGW